VPLCSAHFSAALHRCDTGAVRHTGSSEQQEAFGDSKHTPDVVPILTTECSSDEGVTVAASVGRLSVDVFRALA
jgi:hypothetical protein